MTPDFDAKAREIVTMLHSTTEISYREAIAIALRDSYKAGIEQAHQDERDFIAGALI